MKNISMFLSIIMLSFLFAVMMPLTLIMLLFIVTGGK